MCVCRGGVRQSAGSGGAGEYSIPISLLGWWGLGGLTPSVLTQQQPSGSVLVVDSLGDLEELLLWVSVMKGAVESDLRFSILSLKFPKCLTHCLTTAQAPHFCGEGGGWRREWREDGGREEKGGKEGGRSGAGGGRREEGKLRS